MLPRAKLQARTASRMMWRLTWVCSRDVHCTNYTCTEGLNSVNPTTGTTDRNAEPQAPNPRYVYWFDVLSMVQLLMI